MDNSEIRRQRLLKEIEKHGSIEALSQAVDINPSYLSQIKIRKRNMGSKTARKFERLLGLPEGAWDQPIVDTDKPLTQSENVAPLDERPSFSIPVISWVSAGSWCESPDNYAVGDAEQWIPKPYNAGPHTFALRVTGDSMTAAYPGQRSYPAGTLIYVDPEKEVTNGCRVVARAGGEYTFKTYVEDAGRKFLKPINPQYQMIDITEDTHICGVVIWSSMPE